MNETEAIGTLIKAYATKGQLKILRAEELASSIVGILLIEIASKAKHLTVLYDTSSLDTDLSAILASNSTVGSHQIGQIWGLVTVGIRPKQISTFKGLSNHLTTWFMPKVGQEGIKWHEKPIPIDLNTLQADPNEFMPPLLPDTRVEKPSWIVAALRKIPGLKTRI